MHIGHEHTLPLHVLLLCPHSRSSSLAHAESVWHCQQARTHSFQGFTHGRKLQQETPELPAEALPAVPEMIEPFAAMTPSMSAEAPAPSMSAEAPMTAPGAARHANSGSSQEQIHLPFLMCFFVCPREGGLMCG